MNKGKFLAIDFGDRRAGIAVSDLDKQIAFPRDFFVYDSEDKLIERIKAFCKDEHIIKIILGLPVKMDGSIGEQFIKTQKFGNRLKKEVKPVPIEYLDERLTTKESIKKLSQQGVKAKDQKGQKDMVSAQIILETYMLSRNCLPRI